MPNHAGAPMVRLTTTLVHAELEGEALPPGGPRPVHPALDRSRQRADADGHQSRAPGAHDIPRPEAEVGRQTRVRTTRSLACSIDSKSEGTKHRGSRCGCVEGT